MSEQDTIAVIGAGVIGAAVALALAREGRKVLLLDRAEPGVAGASFGNVGHIAAELVQPLPSPGLLFGFWRELYLFGGALDLPARQVLRMLPWIRRFAAAAFRRAENTRQLSPLVLPAAAAWARWLQEIARPELLRRHGHYEIGFGRKSADQMRASARTMATLGIKTREISAAQLAPLQRAANATTAAGLWFEDSAHVLDPLEIVRALVAAAVARNATFRRLGCALRCVPRGDKLEMHSDQAGAADRRRGGVRRHGLGAPARAFRAACAAASGARLPRRIAGDCAVPRCAGGLHPRARARHSHGRTLARVELHGVQGLPMRRRIRANLRACACRRARSAILSNWKGRAGWARVRCCPTICRGSAVRRGPQGLLRAGTSAYWTYHRSHHRRTGRRFGGGARAAGTRSATSISSASARPRTLSLTELQDSSCTHTLLGPSLPCARRLWESAAAHQKPTMQVPTPPTPDCRPFTAMSGSGAKSNSPTARMPARRLPTICRRSIRRPRSCGSRCGRRCSRNSMRSRARNSRPPSS